MDERCPGCGLELPASDGPTHAYIGASPSCWARFGELLAREYQDPEWFRPHQLTVDAYAVQHPGRPERRSIKSVALHLMTIALVLEQGFDPASGPALHKRMVRRPNFAWLDPPPMDDRVTVLDVLGAGDPAEHERRVRAWAADVWDAWAPHHAQVRAWLAESGASTSGSSGGTA